MGLRIKTNVASQFVQRNLKNSDAVQQQEYAKLSSGKRITKSADDAAGLGIAKKIEAETKGLKMASRNANNGIAMIQVAEGGLNESTNILTRLRELSIQAASDTVGERERGYLNMEYTQLLDEMDRISKTTSFNGTDLLTGENETGTIDFHVGAYAGEKNRIQFDTESTNATIDFLSLAGTSLGSKEAAGENLSKIDTAIDMVSGFRANLGSIQSRLQYTVANLETSIVNQDNARSTIEDVDVAESTAAVASAQVIKQAGIMTLSQANDIPNAALRLIG